MNIFLGQPLPTEANTKIVNKANIYSIHENPR
jgi:hypothetical protein